MSPIVIPLARDELSGNVAMIKITTIWRHAVASFVRKTDV